MDDNKIRLYKIKTVFLYALFGSLWILFSDQAVGILLKDQRILTQVSIAKGWLFILCTSVLLYTLISRDMEAVNTLNRKFRGYFKQALMGMVVLDSAGKVIEMNGVATSILRVEEMDLRGQLFFERMALYYHSDKNAVRAACDLSRFTQGVALYFKTTSEEMRYILTTSSQVVDDHQDGYVLMFIDVTEKVVTEDALMELNMALEDKVNGRTAELKRTVQDLEEANQRILVTDRMTALGELASGIAKEINTPVGIAITAVSYMGVEVEKLQAAVQEGRLKRSEMETLINEMKEAHHLAQRNLEKASEIIGSFKQMSTDIHTNSKRQFKMSEMIGDTIISLRPFVKKGDYQFEVLTGEDQPIFGYPGALSQIISSLILNAIQHGFADRPEGLITIESRVENDILTIDFKDDGVGIPSAFRHEVFTPYFTVGRASESAGLGLSILYKLVTTDLGGTVECYEADGGGAGFRVTMPLA